MSLTCFGTRAALNLEKIVLEWGLTVNIPSTKLAVAGSDETDVQPIFIGEEVIKAVTNFRCLGSIIEASGNIKMEVEDRIGQASRAFGALHRPVFGDKDLSLKTKRLVYNAVVLGALLYGAET